jgi:hypothetical protein
LPFGTAPLGGAMFCKNIRLKIINTLLSKTTAEPEGSVPGVCAGIAFWHPAFKLSSFQAFKHFTRRA